MGEIARLEGSEVRVELPKIETAIHSPQEGRSRKGENLKLFEVTSRIVALQCLVDLCFGLEVLLFEVLQLQLQFSLLP